MTTVIAPAAVIGAGVMGSGIAAHLANAGVPVVLLDVVPGRGGATQRARERRARAERAEPAPFMAPGRGAARHGRATSRTTSACVGSATGSSRRSSSGRRQARALRLARRACGKPGSVVSSNTSTIPLAELRRGAARRFAPRLPGDPLLQPAALPAAARGRGRRGDAAGGRSRRRRGFADRGSERASSPATTRPASSPTGSACLARLGGGRGRRPGHERRGGRRDRRAPPSAAPRPASSALLDLVGIDLVLVVDARRARGSAADPFLGIEWPRKQLEAIVADGRPGARETAASTGAWADGERAPIDLDGRRGEYRAARASPAVSGAEAAALRLGVLASTLAYAA